MEETEETDSDWAQFPSDSCKNNAPAEIFTSISIPSSTSGISTETISVSQNVNETASELEAHSEQLVEGEKSLVQFTSDSSEEKDVGKNDVVTESCYEDLGASTSNVLDEGPSTSNGQGECPSYSNIHGSDEGPPISNHPDLRSQRSRDLHEMSISSGSHYSDNKSGFFSHRSSFKHPALSTWDSSRAVSITLFLIAPKSVENVAIRPQKVMVTHLDYSSIIAFMWIGNGKF